MNELRRHLPIHTKISSAKIFTPGQENPRSGTHSKLASIILSLVAVITSCVDKRKQKKRDRILEEEIRNNYGEPSAIQKKSPFSLV